MLSTFKKDFKEKELINLSKSWTKYVEFCHDLNYSLVVTIFCIYLSAWLVQIGKGIFGLCFLMCLWHHIWPFLAVGEKARFICQGLLGLANFLRLVDLQNQFSCDLLGKNSWFDEESKVDKESKVLSLVIISDTWAPLH